MKTFVAFLLVAIAVALAADIHQEWENYKVKFNKHYDADEDGQRFQIFAENKKFIDEHNAKYEAGEVTWKAALNKFSDWTTEELKKLNGYRPSTGKADAA